MEHAQFWSLVADARGSASALVRTLAKLPADDIAGFDAWWWAYYLATSREDLWAAVYAIRGGCSDDSFDYFRGWLIGRGEQALLAAIRDPEALVDIIGTADPTDESWMSLARVAYEQAGHGELPKTASVEIPGRAGWPADRIAPRVKWTKAFYAEHFPRLHHLVASWPDPPQGAIDHARYWAIIESVAGVHGLGAALNKLTREELVGFDRWHATYNSALIRNDMRCACRLRLGQDDGDSVAGFRGWLMLQGRAAVEAAMQDLDAMLAERPRPEPCFSALFVTWSPLERHGIYSRDHDQLEVIPDRDSWRADIDATPTIPQLRERFPRLTAGRADHQLGGALDVTQLTTYERQRLATDLFERARASAADTERLALLDRAVEAWPQHLEARGLRGRTHAKVGHGDAALADFDAVLAYEPEAAFAQWERSKLRLARGDRDGAVADARAAAVRVEEARLWLSSLLKGTPRRVRHAKFGDGTVVSADDGGSEPKLVVDFAVGRKTIARRFLEAIE